MLRPATLLFALAAALAVPARADDGATLRGSPSSMVRQHTVAAENDYTFLRTGGQVKEFVAKGILVPVEGGAGYAVAASVSFPYGRPEMLTFLERLGAQYREGCGEKLVVTSLTRPLEGQPANAHRLSVHPTGMAVDFRISQSAKCRAWLERTLLGLEREGVLDVTRERAPPHYHVALFTDRYAAHVEKLKGDSLAAGAAAQEPRPSPTAGTAPAPEEKAAASPPAARTGEAPAPERRSGRQPSPFGLVLAAGALAVVLRQRLERLEALG